MSDHDIILAKKEVAKEKTLEDKGVYFTKQAVQLDGVSERNKARMNDLDVETKLTMQGVAGDKLLEQTVNFVELKNEKVMQGENNALAIFGRDRFSHRASGYGGLGDTHAGALDLVVGLASSKQQALARTREDVFVDKDFFADAARVYMSQKTDVDNNFVLATGSVGNCVAKSAIALKADSVRLIAREGIKLVTRTDVKLSSGGPSTSCVGVDLIAGNHEFDDDGKRLLQPMVRGHDLEEALKPLVDIVSSLAGVVFGLVTYQNQINKKIQTHTHTMTPHGVITRTSHQCTSGIPSSYVKLTRTTQNDCQTIQKKCKDFKINYLEDSGPGTFLSPWNNTN
jgi:hypothetical protein